MATFVPITRSDFEGWLDSLPYQYSLQTGSVGVYVIHLSPLVGVRVGSSMSRKPVYDGDNTVMDRGKGAIHMALVSRKTGEVLNKKALGQSRFNRTEGWRKSLTRGVEALAKAYKDAQDFYDRNADRTRSERAVEQEQNSQQREEQRKRIESIPNWETNHALKDMHQQAQRKPLTEKQMAFVDKLEALMTKAPKVDVVMVERLRDLYREARRQGDRSKLTLIESFGKQVAAGRTLSPKQMNLIITFEQQLGMGKRASRIVEAGIRLMKSDSLFRKAVLQHLK